MKAFILIATLLVPAIAEAGTSCTTRKSGSTTITSCSGKSGFSECRSYRSGSVIKTSCR